MRLFCIFLLLLLASCSAQPEYINAPLYMPPKPILPSIEEKELLCLSEPAYKALVKRDLLLQQHIEKLRLIIKNNNSTHS